MSVPGTVAWYLFLVFVVLSYQRLTRCLTTLNVFTLFLLFFLMRHGISVPFDVSVNDRVTNMPLSTATIARTNLALVIMYVCMIAATWFTGSALRTPNLPPHDWSSQLRVQSLPVGINRSLFWLAWVCVMGLVLLTWTRLPAREIVALWKEGLSAEQYKTWREAYGNVTNYARGGLTYLGSFARWALLPTLVYVLYCLRGRGRSYRFAFILSVAVALLVGLISGQKSAAMFLVMGLLVTVWFASGRVAIRPWDVRLVATATTLFFLVLPSLYAIQYPFLDYTSRIQLGAFRLTSESDRGLQLYFHFYPETYPHLGGASSVVLNKVLLLGYTELPPEQRIPVAVVGPDYTNTWNASFIATAWADFGWWGVVFESLFVGSLLQLIHHWFVTSKKSAAIVGVYAGLIMAATRLSEVSLFSSLWSYGLGSSLILFLLIKQPLSSPAARADTA